MDVLTDGEQRRDFVFVDDVVAVNLWFLQQPARSGIFNVGTGRAATYNAVAAATINAAAAISRADRIGSLEPGKQADLIVTTGSPAQTVTIVTHEFIDGRPIDLSNMQTENYDKFKSRPAPKLPPPRTDLKGPRSLSAK